MSTTHRAATAAFPRSKFLSDFVLDLDNKARQPALYRLHDGLIRDNFWRSGIGASCGFTPRTSGYASIATVLAGTNTHYGYLYNVGVSWSFNRGDQDKRNGRS